MSKKTLIHENEEDKILCKELSDISKKDQVHLIIPACDRFALAIAFFAGWDIKNYYKKYDISVSVIGHIILPDIA